VDGESQAMAAGDTVEARAGREPGDIDLGSITEEEEQRWKKLRWVWCQDCGGGTIMKSGWGHKAKTTHNVTSLKDAGKYDEALR
jgi:hypothetical protein